MCGRTAQTQEAVLAASISLKAIGSSNLVDDIGPRVLHDDDDSGNSQNKDTRLAEGVYPWGNNFNLSPGHDAVVFTMDEDGAIHMNRKVWGLVTKNGTEKSPLPRGPSKHFANLMFNARSDTLFSKPTFSRLLNQRKTCLVAVDGFFEWKSDALPAGKGKKQPFYVYRNKSPEDDQDHYSGDEGNQRGYLLMAGLWESVSTGWPEQPKLDTFTIITTEVCDPLKWLHSRMPVCVWDEELALQWLKQPSQKIENELHESANQTPESFLQWHAVTTQMSSTSYRSRESIKAVRMPKTVKSFFAPAKDAAKHDRGSFKDHEETSSSTTTSHKPTPLGNSTPTNSSPVSSYVAKKRPATPGTTSADKQKTSSSSKKQKPIQPVKKGSITSFFAPKK